MRFPEFSGEWERITLHEVIKIQGGYAFKSEKFQKEGIPIIRISNLPQDTSTVDLSDCVYYDNCRLSNFEISNGELLIAMSGATTGKTAVYRGCEIAYLNQRVGCFKVKEESQLFYPYLYALVDTKVFKEQLTTRLIAGAQPNISSLDIETIKICLPKFDEQIKIAQCLAVIEERISTQKKIIEDLKKLKDAICNLNFTSGSSLILGNVGYFVRGLTYSASDVIDDTMGTAVMRSNNISNGEPVNFNELVWVNKTPHQEQILRDGDMVICMANGSSPLVGKASYYIDGVIELATIGAFCGIYRSDNPLIKWLFQSTHYKTHIQRCVQGGNGAIANIYPEDILAISFNIPADHERILNTLNSLEEKHLLEQKLLYRYLAIKSHLLTQMFI